MTAINREDFIVADGLRHTPLNPISSLPTKNCLSALSRSSFFAGPKRGWPCLGFPDLVRMSVRPSPFGLILPYTANIPQTPNIFTDSGPPIK